MKNYKMILFIVIVTILIACLFVVLTKNGSDKKKERIEAETKALNISYIRDVGAKGTFTYKNNKVISDDLVIDRYKIVENISAYNVFTNNNINVEQVVDAYNKFCNGEEYGTILNELVEFRHNKIYPAGPNAERDYNNYIYTVLREEYDNKSALDMSEDEYTEVCTKAAKKWYEANGN